MVKLISLLQNSLEQVLFVILNINVIMLFEVEEASLIRIFKDISISFGSLCYDLQ